MRSRLTWLSMAIVALMLLYGSGYVALRWTGKLTIWTAPGGKPFIMCTATPIIEAIYQPLFIIEWRLRGPNSFSSGIDI